MVLDSLQFMAEDINLVNIVVLTGFIYKLIGFYRSGVEALISLKRKMISRINVSILLSC